MKLLTKELREKLPKFHAQEDKGEEAIAYIKFFTPWTCWTWYATEGEPILDEQGNEVDFHFFGLVFGLEKEFGYFSLKELESVKGPFGLSIERDMGFTPCPIKDCNY